MRPKLIYLIIIAFSLVSCDIDSDWSDPDDPYEEYSGRMIERISIEQNNSESDYIYYGYDRRGRITSIENTFYQTIDRFAYGEDEYGDDIITVSNNLGEDRDIIVDWDGYAEKEVAYSNGAMAQSIEYDYLSDQLWNIEVEEYYNDGTIFSEESYDFNLDHNDNLCSIERSYEEDDYDIDSELTFSAFSECENNYNVDILSIIGLYIDDDFASHIGRTGERSRYLPTRAALRTKRNGRYDNDVEYRISYTVSGDHISTISVSSTNSTNKSYHISYKNN